MGGGGGGGGWSVTGAILELRKGVNKRLKLVVKGGGKSKKGGGKFGKYDFITRQMQERMNLGKKNHWGSITRKREIWGQMGEKKTGGMN